MLPTAFQREPSIERLAETDFDVLIVGGGITGVGCALDAASRGLRTALVERHDFASGTSSKSSKLVHGGLRYLQQGEVRLVYEALAERQRLRRNAPHLVKVLPFLIPVFTGRDGVISKKLSRALGSAMWAYDLTGGLRIGKLHKRISATEAHDHMPSLRSERLAASYLYYDARADDARLTLAVARTAACGQGAVVVNRAAVSAIGAPEPTRRGPAMREVTVTLAEGNEITVRTAAVINAAGVWADDVRALDEGTHPDSIRPAKGIHITVPWDRIRNDIAAVLPVRADKRSIFVVPWGKFTYIGTTDTDYDGPTDDPQCTEDDIEYLLTAVNAVIEGEITRHDVLGTWAGLRPLVRSEGETDTADLSRRHQVVTSPDGVVTVTGGKLTTYREMAADTVDKVLTDVLDHPSVTERTQRRSRTARMPLIGAAGYEELAAEADSASSVLDGETVTGLAERYGGEARTLIAMVESDPDLGRPLIEGLPYLRAEALFAARYEMATTLDDILSRRLRARLLMRDASGEAAADVAALIASDMGWDEAEQQRQVADYRARIAEERSAPDLPTTALSAATGA